MYFTFKTPIILGLSGDVFPLLCLVPVIIFTFEAYHGKLDTTNVALYVIFFLASISWFCLAKSHSYIHLHLNFVLWYFGFVQVCLYTICRKIICFFKPSFLDR